MQDDSLTAEEREDSIRTIIRSTKYLSRMTENILNLSHLENQAIISDQALASHIWKNLLDNAVKFTPPGGEIIVTAHKDHERLFVCFRNSGIGMAPEVQARIFDKFYQGDTSHRNEGSGLGLPLVRRIVTLYGASIGLDSSPDKGTAFTVTLQAGQS